MVWTRYIVAFRSIREASSDSVDLYEADRAAHEEAVSNGGLILYWFALSQNDGKKGVFFS
jgi:hypothetical protein